MGALAGGGDRSDRSGLRRLGASGASSDEMAKENVWSASLLKTAVEPREGLDLRSSSHTKGLFLDW